MTSRSQSSKVLVIGDVMLDVVAAPSGAIEIGADTPATIALLPGGSGANQAAWLGHLGNDVVFVGRAGSDSYDWHVAALRAHGVEPRMARDETVRTGILVNLISIDGERSFLTDRGANAGLTRADLPDMLLDGIALVHFSGYALSNDGSRAAVLDFLEVAGARGIPITVDPGAVSFLRAVGPPSFLAWTHRVTICFPNAAEATLLAGTPAEAEQLRILGAHYTTLVIKNGAAGAVAASGAQCFRAVGPRQAAVDTTGAGDAFVAGFLSAYTLGEPIAACLQAGVAVGAQAVSRLGGRPPDKVSGCRPSDNVARPSPP